LEDCTPGTFSLDKAQVCNKCPYGMYAPNNRSTYCLPCVNNTFASNHGAGSCRSCSYPFINTTSTSLCSTNNCNFYSGINVTSTGAELFYYFNESRFQNIHVDTTTMHYYVSLCHKVNSSLCRNANGEHIPSHVCAVSKATNKSENYGSDINVKYSTSGILLQFNYGDACPTGNKRATISFTCGRNLGSLVLVNNTPCEINFAWRGWPGCRACGDKDFVTMRSACSGGNTYVSTKLRADDCIDWKNLEHESSESCNSIEFPFFIVIVIALVMIVLIVFLILAIVRHNRLYKEYSQLRNVHVGDDDDDDFNVTSDLKNVSLDEDKDL